jgi:hypothetical protein
MIDVIIVCAYDGLKTGQTLQRLLAAEDHNVELLNGRSSTAALESARAGRQAVLLIWSLDAPSASYMLDWAQKIDPTRLVEVQRAPGAPRVEGRKASVIDFSSWSGERGGGAWRALIERLRIVQRACEPPKPVPMRAAMALGAASVMAVTGALVVRVNDSFNGAPTEDVQVASTPIEELGQGGPLRTLEEPASYEEVSLNFTTRRARLQTMPMPADIALADMPAPYEPQALRRETVLERLSGLGDALLSGEILDGDRAASDPATAR